MKTKTFDKAASIVFTITAAACFVCGFYNAIHFLFSALCAFLACLSWWEYESEE